MSAVISVENDTWGESGLAFIVPEDGMTLDVTELESHSKENLAAYKRPIKIIIEKDVPKTGIGKIAKNELHQVVDKYM